MPRNLTESARLDKHGRRRAWIKALPSVVERLREKWSLVLGDPFQPGGQTAWVAPTRTHAGGDMVLKILWRHPEAEHEAEGLRAWAGQGVVLLYESEESDDTIAMLIERCLPGEILASRPEDEQDTVIVSLLPRLWRQPPRGHRFRPLKDMCEAWAAGFERKAAARPVNLDPRLAREGMALFRSLPTTADRNVLLCTDLHAENVLSAQREPWLMIDPKPYVGDPTYDPLQHFLNCRERLLADPAGLARRTAHLLGLDGDRLVLWLFARCVHESPNWRGAADVVRRLASDPALAAWRRLD